jgi:hypothetical protein
MKKYVFILLLTFLSASAYAQISFGPRLGLNISKISFTEDDFKTGFRPGFVVGGVANYKIMEKLSVQAELVYSSESSSEERISSGTKGHLTMGFIQLPILAQYELIKGLCAEAGPQIGFLLSAKESYGGGSGNNIKPYYKKTDIRFPIGVGYKLPVDGLSAGIRYSFSLTKLNNVEVGGGNLKFHTIQIAATYRF